MARLTKTWTFQSNSNPNKSYETSQYEDGSTSCQCRGWTFAKNGVRSCTHTRKVEQGLADREALSVWNGNLPRGVVPASPVQTYNPVTEKKAAASVTKLASIKKRIEAEKPKPKPKRVVNWR